VRCEHAQTNSRSRQRGVLPGGTGHRSGPNPLVVDELAGGGITSAIAFSISFFATGRVRTYPSQRSRSRCYLSASDSTQGFLLSVLTTRSRRNYWSEKTNPAESYRCPVVSCKIIQTFQPPLSVLSPWALRHRDGQFLLGATFIARGHIPHANEQRKGRGSLSGPRPLRRFYYLWGLASCG